MTKYEINKSPKKNASYNHFTIVTLYTILSFYGVISWSLIHYNFLNTQCIQLRTFTVAFFSISMKKPWREHLCFIKGYRKHHTRATEVNIHTVNSRGVGNRSSPIVNHWNTLLAVMKWRDERCGKRCSWRFFKCVALCADSTVWKKIYRVIFLRAACSTGSQMICLLTIRGVKRQKISDDHSIGQNLKSDFSWKHKD